MINSFPKGIQDYSMSRKLFDQLILLGPLPITEVGTYLTQLNKNYLKWIKYLNVTALNHKILRRKSQPPILAMDS